MPVMTRKIFQQYGIIPMLLEKGATDIHCQRMGNLVEIFCTSPAGRKMLIKATCTGRSTQLIEAAVGLASYARQFPDHELVLVIPAEVTVSASVDLSNIKEQLGIRIVRLPYPDLSRITFKEQAYQLSYYMKKE